MTSKTKYERQRQPHTPPHVSLASLRNACGLTIDDVRSRIAEEWRESDPQAEPPSRGTISAIENGHRGVSASMLVALARAYGLSDDAIVTDYEPRHLRATG